MAGEVLPEVAGVHWRARMDARRLRMLGRLWTATTVAHVVPFLAAAAGLMVLQPLTAPVALACLAHAWIIPELYANRGATVANLAFSGARWRVKRRLPKSMRPALDEVAGFSPLP